MRSAQGVGWIRQFAIVAGALLVSIFTYVTVHWLIENTSRTFALATAAVGSVAMLLLAVLVVVVRSRNLKYVLSWAALNILLCNELVLAHFQVMWAVISVPLALGGAMALTVHQVGHTNAGDGSAP